MTAKDTRVQRAQSGTVEIGKLRGRVLVSGASGFIGRALCAELTAKGASVMGLGRHPVAGPWTSFQALDLSQDPLDTTLLDGIDTVFHLAGRAHAVDERGTSEALYFDANVESTKRLLKIAQIAGVRRFVLFSSVKAMGEGEGRPATEEDEPRPQTAYGRSKLEAERCVAAAQGVEGVSLRLPMVYGPGCKGNLPRMMSALAAGRFPPLPDTANLRSMVNVRNVVAAAAHVATHPAANAGQAYIVTDAVDYSTATLVAAIREVVQKPAPAWSVPLPVLVGLARLGDGAGALLGRRIGFDTDALDKLLGSARYSAGKIRDELGFIPTAGLEQGLREMYEDLQGASD